MNGRCTISVRRGFAPIFPFVPASKLHRLLEPLLVHCLLDLLSLRKTKSIMRSVIRTCAACDEGTFIKKQHQNLSFSSMLLSISLGFQVQDLPSPHTPSEADGPTGCRTARPHRRVCWLWSPGGRKLPPRPYDWPGHRATPDISNAGTDIRARTGRKRYQRNPRNGKTL